MKFWKFKTVLITIAIIIVNCQLSIINCFSQNVGINITGAAPNSSSLLDVDANNKGILIPRLPLTATNVGAPISPAPGAGEKGLMVYNTATAGISPNDVVPGFYYWTGSVWSPLGGSGSSGAGGWTDDGTVVRLTTSTDFVGIGTASPASTSALDITSTTKGLLIPRMTTAQRDAIPTPATGLQVYNTDCQTLNYWTGTCWISNSKSLPSPGAISSTPASTVFCAGQSRTYTIVAVPGATTYTWTVPAGTTINSGQGTVSINATFGNISGNVCVDASNSCETSPVRCISVSVDPIPNTPGNITGITSINPGQQSVTYFVASVNGASTYTWSVPAGATIASGTGTTTIVVNFACNSSSGNISVTANSTCGSSPASALALTITPLLAASAGSAVFGGTSQTIGGSPTATGGTTAYTYSWNTSANLSSSTIANPIAYCTGSTTTYVVTVTDSRSCTATSSVVVTRDLTASAGAAKFGGTGIGGSPTATGGAGSYGYSWTPTNNLSSYTIANPIAPCAGATSTLYTVTVTDANSCTASSSMTVTRNLAVNAGSSVYGGVSQTIGNAATGGAGGYGYSWTPTNDLSSYTIANPVAPCAGATSTLYTVTATDANSCTATSSVTVTRNLSANAGGNQSVTCSGVAIGGSPTANGGNATYTYSWNPGTSLSSTTAANPTAGASGTTTTYTVTVTDANGCIASNSMTLTRSGCTVTYNYTGALQNWTVPAGVTSISIEAWGAGGATNACVGIAGGLGARMKGTIAVTPGQILKVLVGGQGLTGSSRAGGGGGSFVTDNSNNPLVIAGGGGGGGYQSTSFANASIGTAGLSQGDCSCGGGGTNGGGGGGGNSGSGGGGGGLLGSGGAGNACAYCGSAGAGGNGANGTNATACGGCYPPGGNSFITGGAGGSSSANGGFGGGGSSYSWNCGGGGGGGYSGGGGGGYGYCGNSQHNCGGGGGSYNGGTNQSNSAGVQSGNGQVVITY